MEIAPGPVAEELTSVLGVLKREQTPIERIPPRWVVEKTLMPSPLSWVWGSGIRRLERGRYVLLAGQSPMIREEPVVAIFDVAEGGSALVFGVRTGPQLAAPMLPCTAHAGRVAELVPDGVARVEVAFEDGARVSAAVVENLWVVEREDAGDPYPTSIAWLDGSGDVVASV